MLNLVAAIAGLALAQSAGTSVPPPLGGGGSSSLDASAPPKKTPAKRTHDDDVKSDAEMGKKLADQVEKEYKVSKNAEFQARVDRIGQPLADIANASTVEVSWGDRVHSSFQYHFRVLEGEDVNAFSLPGGYIFVYEGLMKYVESDDELAGVLAHEISHAAFRHLATLQREENKMTAITLPLILIAILGGGQWGSVFELGQLIGVATGSGWSQKAEESADYGGFQFLLKSKFNPVGELTFMERLAADERNRPKIDWGIYRTHPPSRERADELLARLEAAHIQVRRSQVTQTFRTVLKPGKDGAIDAWFGGRRLYTFAGKDSEARGEAAAKRIDAFMDAVPELYEVSAGADGIVYGNRRTLFTVTRADAEASKLTVSQATDKAVQSVKRSLVTLAYRIWDLR